MPKRSADNHSAQDNKHLRDDPIINQETIVKK